MKKVILSCLLALSLVTASLAAEKPLGMKEYTSVDQLAAAISSYFPKVQGEVKSVEGDKITITLGTKDGLQQGVVLTVWRDGKEIRHPVTNLVIGHLEDEVGSLEVTVPGETTSVGVMQKKMMEPKVGDKARITPKKIGIAIIPLRADHPEIIQGLADRLKESGRFTVLENEKAAAFLSDKKQRDASLIKEIGKTFNLDIVLTIEIIPSESKYLVTAGLYYADDARPLDTIVAMLDLRTKRDALGEVTPFFAPPMEEKREIADLPFDAQLFAAADLEGTGSLQYVFSDGAKLHVFKQGPSGWREEWVEKIPYASGEMQHFNLDVADINGNGRPEIFVTGMLKGAVISYVIEFKDGIYQRIADVPGFLRVLASPRKEGILLGQGYDPVSFYVGQPKQYVWLEGKYVPASEVPLPKGVDLYGFTYADAGEASPLLVSLSDKDQLIVFLNGNAIWRSEEKYPAVETIVIKPLTGVDAVLSSSSEIDKARKVRIRGRVSTADLNGDGKDEILLPKNSGGILLGGYKEAEFIDLGWTGARLEQRWNIKDIPGVVRSYQIIRQQGSGAQILALVMTPGGLFAADRVRVMSYATK
ncbi:MAG: VCBS repeat-containing protein [Nitrospirota bacterium]